MSLFETSRKVFFLLSLSAAVRALSDGARTRQTPPNASDVRHRNLQTRFMEDDTLTVNGGASALFNLMLYDETDSTIQVFRLLPDPIPNGATITCQLDCTSINGDLAIIVMQPFTLPTTNLEGIENDLASMCPAQITDIMPSEGTLYVYAYDDLDRRRKMSVTPESPSTLGRMTGASITCTSPDLPTPTLTPTAEPSSAPSVAPSPAPTDSPTPNPTPCDCLSSETQVDVKGKGTILMKDLEVNDEVFVGTTSKNNQPIYQKVFSFGHSDKHAPTEYYQIHTANTNTTTIAPLEISKAHLLYVAGKKYPVRADSIKPGDLLVHKTLDGPTQVVPVTKINKIVRNGAYMPLTKDGSLVVNNLLASAYVSIHDQAPGIVEKYATIFSEDQLLHWWLAPYRMVCLGISSNLCKGDKDEVEGIAYYLLLGRYVAQVGETYEGTWFQIFGLVVFGMIMAAFVLLEALVTLPFGSLSGFVIGSLLVAALVKKPFGFTMVGSKRKVD